MSSLQYPDGVPHSWRCAHTPAEMRPMMCEECTSNDVFTLYARINNAYREGNPLMSDWRWDVFEAFCRDRFPDDTRFHKVGVVNE